MRIPLRVRVKFGQPIPFVFAILRAPHLRPIPINFLVDTGSPWVAIAPADSRRLGISLSRLRRASEHLRVRFAGYVFQRLLLENVTLYLRDEDGAPVRVPMSPVTVLKPLGKPTSYVESLPSVLGSDFMVAGGFALYFNPANRTAYLERPPSSGESH